MRLNKEAHLLQVGDKVTTDIYRTGHIILTITAVVKSAEFGSGYGASAIGNQCSSCGLTPPSVGFVDAAWFIPFKKIDASEV